MREKSPYGSGSDGQLFDKDCEPLFADADSAGYRAPQFEVNALKNSWAFPGSVTLDNGPAFDKFAAGSSAILSSIKIFGEIYVLNGTARNTRSTLRGLQHHIRQRQLRPRHSVRVPAHRRHRAGRSRLCGRLREVENMTRFPGRGALFCRPSPKRLPSSRAGSAGKHSGRWFCRRCARASPRSARSSCGQPGASS